MEQDVMRRDGFGCAYAWRLLVVFSIQLGVWLDFRVERYARLDTHALMML